MICETKRIQQQLNLVGLEDCEPAGPKKSQARPTASSEVAPVRLRTIPHRGTKTGAMERLKRNLEKNSETGCLEWKWPLKPSKIKHNLVYPMLRVHGVKIAAHRAAYILQVGPVPDGLVVRHRCDNPICCNVEHLELGTQQDNVNDVKARGRGAGWYESRNRGVENPNAKLNEETVRYIRSRWKFRKVTAKMIAAELGITKNAVSNVLSGHVWGWVK